MSKKTRRILILIYVVAFLITCFGATLAYFTVIKTSTVSSKVDVESITMTSIVFHAGDPIALYANIDNFSQGMDSLKGSTFASSTLKVGTEADKATFHYNVSIAFYENTLLYSTGKDTPEAIITIKDPNGNEVTNINGLEYKTVNGISGFDVTGKVGEFSIAKNYEITTDDEITQKWDVELTFVNLAFSQDLNRGKGLNGSLMITPIYEDGV